MKLSKECLEVLEKCSNAPVWIGETITSLDQKNWLGDTPLHTLCTQGNLEPVRILVENGADVNAKGDHGSPPMINAIIGKNADIVRYLISKGADVNKKNDLGWLPLEYAKDTKAPAEIITLLEKETSKSKGKKKK